MATIRDENFYVIQGWMLRRLHLTGNVLIIYAILWSFSQDGVSEFRGTVEYLSEFAGASRATVLRALESLEARGLIEKEIYNDKTGKTNGYKCVPYEALKLDEPELETEAEGVAETQAVSQNAEGGCIKMIHPVSQNETGVSQNDTPPLHNKKENINISKLYKKESKKEVNIYTNTREPAREDLSQRKEDERSALPSFEEMTDEELLDFGEIEVDYGIEGYYEILEAYERELKRRKEASAKKWRKKVVKAAGKFEYLKSHEEILREWGVQSAYAEAIRKYLTHSYARHRLVTNVQLEEILSRLDETYGEDDVSKIKCVEFSLQRGYTGIVIGGELRR